MKHFYTASMIFLVAVGLGLAGGVTFANAERAKCGKRDALVTMLKQRFSEVPVSMGVGQKNTTAFEVFASEKGTWTIMMTMTNGMTCIMAAGHSWKNLPKEMAGSLI